jgi:hypothetical protein
LLEAWLRPGTLEASAERVRGHLRRLPLLMLLNPNNNDRPDHCINNLTDPIVHLCDNSV